MQPHSDHPCMDPDSGPSPHTDRRRADPRSASRRWRGGSAPVRTPPHRRPTSRSTDAVRRDDADT